MKVIFSTYTYQKWRAYINSIKYEISGKGKVRFQDGIFFVEDLQIWRQEVTDSGTILNKNAMGRWEDDLIKGGGDPSEWKLWWHSHAEHKAFFSTIDERTIADFDNLSHEDNWMLSIVSNRNNETEIRLDIFSPLRVTIESIPYDISFEDQELEENILDEVTEKVEIFLPKSNKVRRNSQVTTWGVEHQYGYRGRPLLDTETGLPLLEANTALKGEVYGD